MYFATKEIDMKRWIDNIRTVHCLFEQTGTFRDEFRALGFRSFDYDIENGFQTTDFQVNLLNDIQAAYLKRKSVIGKFGPRDFVMAFFPCTYFNQANRLMLRMDDYLKKDQSDAQKIRSIIKRAKMVFLYYERLNQLLAVSLRNGFPMIIENPCTGSLIRSTFYREPDIIDSNRAEFGDDFRKPTCYWFVNCRPMCSAWNNGYKASQAKHTVFNGARGFGRSMITKDYARNFIRVAIMGEDPIPQQMLLPL